MIRYIETSASIKLVVEEPESVALASSVEQARADGDVIITSTLTHTEMHRSGHRLDLDPVLINSVLGQLSLVSMDDQDFQVAAQLPGRNLRSLDALHVAVALRYRCDSFYSYDSRQSTAAQHAGLAVLHPN